MRTQLTVQAILVSTAMIFAAPTASMAEPVQAPLPAMIMSNAIVITNTGATNLIGYRVVISADGHAAFVSDNGSGDGMLPPRLFDRLERDVSAAIPLAQLTKLSCMKSASFGTSTFVAIGGDRSPDLSCPADGIERTLQQDIRRVDAFLSVSNVNRSYGTKLPPQRF